jgi:NADH-quinone oxidoreductase subunit H
MTLASLAPLVRPLLAAGDPLFAKGVDLGIVVVVIVKTVATFAVLMVAVLFMVWFERKVIARVFQNRIGPNRAGPFGLLQTLADGIKLFFKEDLAPDAADLRIFRLAPYLSAVPAFLLFAIIPVGGTISIFGHRTLLQLADPPIGILFMLAMSSVAVYGVMLAGWSSGSKYPLLGSVRASAQMVSYEAAMGLSVAAVVLITGSLSTRDIIDSQAGGLGHWNLLRLGIVPFIIFVVASTAELNRPPFDLVEAEQEIVGGFHTEYSSIRFALFYLAEFMNTVTMSGVMVTLFLGGPSSPFGDFLNTGIFWGVFWFVVKLFLFLFGHVWLRATLPRLRYDQLMDLGWKRLIPLALGWLLIDGAIILGRWRYIPVVFALGILFYLLLARSMTIGRSNAEEALN